MIQQFFIHPHNPQIRALQQVARLLKQGGVVAYPTDSFFALGCCLEQKDALDRIRSIRQLDPQHRFSIICRDLSELALYAKVDNSAFRLLKHNTPGPYTFILNATRDVPRRLMHPKRRTLGLRIPNHRLLQELMACLGEPIITTTLILPDHPEPLFEAWQVHDCLQHQIDGLIDSSECGTQPTTVVDLSAGTPTILRIGAGDTSPFNY